METTLPRPTLGELTALFEDTVAHACAEYQLSGQLVLTVMESFATAKLADFPDNA